MRRLGLSTARFAAAAIISGAVVTGWSWPASAVGGAAFFPMTEFTAVSCTSATDCTAVGHVGQGSSGAPFSGPVYEPVYATEINGVWGKTIELPADVPAQFTSVSCSSATDCTAVGYDYRAGFDNHGVANVGFPIYATETAGKWGSVSEYTSAGSGMEFLGVSCPSASSCTVVGGAPGGTQAGAPIAVTESAGTWGPAKAFTTTGLGYLSGVSCTSATDCTAVGVDMQIDGEFGLIYDNLPIYATETAGSWGAAVEVAAPTGGVYAGFNSVSCSSTANCTAVGSDGSPGDSFYATESKGIWGPATGVAIPGKWAGLFSVSCTSSSDCAAVGETWSATPDIGFLPVRLTETAGVWGPASIGSVGSLYGVSCPSFSQCTSVGSYDLCAQRKCVGPSGFPIYTSEDAGAWPTVPSAPRISKVIAGNRSVRVVWAAPPSDGGTAIAGYTAIAIRSGREYLCSSTGTSCLFSGLTNGKPYAITVFARNDVGSSRGASPTEGTPRARTMDTDRRHSDHS